MTYRVQLSRTKDYRRPAGTVQVDRATIFGNPFQVGDPGRWNWPKPDRAGYVMDLFYISDIDQEHAVFLFESWLIRDQLFVFPQSLTPSGKAGLHDAMIARRKLIFSRLPTLRGHPLGCRCPLDQPCHADVLLQMANITPGAA